ncbi:MAG TPA: hypothetical protein VMW83_02120 [Spirochaetia bacterium]|nr:hypothetical protein [Spirochaetia bacterium]
MPGMSLQINIFNLRIADVDTGSAVAIGNNYFFEWKTNAKSNTGFGRVSGDCNSLADLMSCVDDPDFQDMFSHESLSGPGLNK